MEIAQLVKDLSSSPRTHVERCTCSPNTKETR